MKQIFMALATILFLTFSNNIITVNNSNIITSVKPPVATNQDNNYLFNNTYHRFDRTNDFITNQSNSDHKFYSYNARKSADYLLKDGKTHAYEVLMVNNEGQLVKSIKVNDEDQAQLNSTIDIMNREVQITSIKDDYNIYSNSQYSSTYFTGANNNWTYLQFGGFNSHIDISDQINGNLVENNSNLSESLGLYYIAKAVRTGAINLSVANLLGDYFISKSSFKNKITLNLCHKIIKLITYNDEIYNLVYQTPFGVDNKNYALNYIFDGNNNLIELYYTNWTTNDINKTNINYSWSDSYISWRSDNSNIYTLLKWTDYARDWDTFTKIYPTFNFDNNSYLKLSAFGGYKSVQINFPSVLQTASILTNQGNGNTNSLTSLYLPLGPLPNRYYPSSGYANLDLNIWHDDNNIVFKWFFNVKGSAKINIDIKLNDATFFNTMK